MMRTWWSENWFVVAAAALFVAGGALIMAAGAAQSADEAAHRARGERCVRVSTAYVRVGDALVPLESCAEWGRR